MKTVIVLLGPTAVGKTALSLEIAERLGSPIISADSRQMFRDIPIGTAAPTVEDLCRVPHHFVGQLDLTDSYNAARYEREALALIEQLPQERLIVSGGSMLYIDALCRGIDEMPDIDPLLRESLRQCHKLRGLDTLVEELRMVDPDYYGRCDLKNPVRVIHALEVFYQTGRPFSSFLLNNARTRPFRIVKIGLTLPREELFDRINRRTDFMVEQGFIDEARRVLPFRELNSLNTVGFKEMFRYLDGEWELPFTLDRIRKNTRVYAKKQMTWFQRDSDIHWFHPDDSSGIFSFLGLTP